MSAFTYKLGNMVHQAFLVATCDDSDDEDSPVWVGFVGYDDRASLRLAVISYMGITARRGTDGLINSLSVNMSTAPFCVKIYVPAHRRPSQLYLGAAAALLNLSTDSQPNQFVKGGESWQIGCEGEVLHIPGVKGFLDLAQLMDLLSKALRISSRGRKMNATVERACAAVRTTAILSTSAVP
jgi:hypothetical protein